MNQKTLRRVIYKKLVLRTVLSRKGHQLSMRNLREEVQKKGIPEDHLKEEVKIKGWEIKVKVKSLKMINKEVKSIRLNIEEITDWVIKARFLKKSNKKGKSMLPSTRNPREKIEVQDLVMRVKVKENLCLEMKVKVKENQGLEMRVKVKENQDLVMRVQVKR